MENLLFLGVPILKHFRVIKIYRIEEGEGRCDSEKETANSLDSDIILQSLIFVVVNMQFY